MEGGRLTAGSSGSGTSSLMDLISGERVLGVRLEMVVREEESRLGRGSLFESGQDFVVLR